MGFSKKLKYWLVHSYKLSNKEAQQMIDNAQVELNGLTIHENCLLEDTFEIKLRGKIIRQTKKFVYLKFYKARGLESTLNKNFDHGISNFFKNYHELAIAGRLDKESEGLLLLSNDGQWVENICNPNFKKEKEYQVTLDRMPDSEFLKAFRSGVIIGDYKTLPCLCDVIEGSRIKVILTEGKNRQIRHMCKALNYQVTRLKRIRIDSIHLEEMEEGEIKHLNS